MTRALHWPRGSKQDTRNFLPPLLLISKLLSCVKHFGTQQLENASIDFKGLSSSKTYKFTETRRRHLHPQFPKTLTKPPAAPLPTAQQLAEDLAVATGKIDETIHFAPPSQPDKELKYVVCVPTFVDYDCVFHVQEVKEGELLVEGNTESFSSTLARNG